MKNLKAKEIRTSNITLIESGIIDGPYGQAVTEAIIEHPTRGRIYISQGFGGIDTLQGGAIRWRHGRSVEVDDNDTLNTLHSDIELGVPCTRLDWLEHRRCSQHQWSGIILERIAGKLGL